MAAIDPLSLLDVPPRNVAPTIATVTTTTTTITSTGAAFRSQVPIELPRHLFGPPVDTPPGWPQSNQQTAVHLVQPQLHEFCPPNNYYLVQHAMQQQIQAMITRIHQLEVDAEAKDKQIRELEAYIDSRVDKIVTEIDSQLINYINNVNNVDNGPLAHQNQWEVESSTDNCQMCNKFTVKHKQIDLPLLNEITKIFNDKSDKLKVTTFDGTSPIESELKKLFYIGQNVNIRKAETMITPMPIDKLTKLHQKFLRKGRIKVKMK